MCMKAHVLVSMTQGNLSLRSTSNHFILVCMQLERSIISYGSSLCSSTNMTLYTHTQSYMHTINVHTYTLNASAAVFFFPYREPLISQVD
jgi:hypothetical protein